MCCKENLELVQLLRDYVNNAGAVVGVIGRNYVVKEYEREAAIE